MVVLVLRSFFSPNSEFKPGMAAVIVVMGYVLANCVTISALPAAIPLERGFSAIAPLSYRIVFAGQHSVGSFLMQPIDPITRVG